MAWLARINRAARVSPPPRTRWVGPAGRGLAVWTRGALSSASCLAPWRLPLQAGSISSADVRPCGRPAVGPRVGMGETIFPWNWRRGNCGHLQVSALHLHRCTRAGQPVPPPFRAGIFCPCACMIRQCTWYGVAIDRGNPVRATRLRCAIDG